MLTLPYILQAAGLYHPVPIAETTAKLSHIRILTCKVSNEAFSHFVYNSFHNTVTIFDSTVWENYYFRECSDSVKLAFRNGKMEVIFYAR